MDDLVSSCQVITGNTVRKWEWISILAGRLQWYMSRLRHKCLMWSCWQWSNGIWRALFYAKPDNGLLSIGPEAHDQNSKNG